MKVVSTNKVNRLWNKGVLEKLKLKINATDIINNFTTTVAGKVADARALKTLKDELDQLNGKMATINLASVNAVYFGFDSNTYYIEFWFSENNKYRLFMDFNNIVFTRWDGTEWNEIWRK